MARLVAFVLTKCLKWLLQCHTIRKLSFLNRRFYTNFLLQGENPFLTGERLPIAAKKGFDVNVY